MSIVCEKVPQSDIVKKSAYYGVENYVLVKRSERPKDIEIAKKWCMEPCYMPSFYEEIAQRIENFEVRPDDVWVVTYAKCGTTWTQEMVWQICNDLDYETAKNVALIERFPFIEFGSILARDLELTDEVSRAEKMPSPRMIKTHLPAHLLPRQIWTVRPKIIYVARNTKDTAISFYHHYRNIHRFVGTFDDFMEAFLQDKIIFSPFHTHIIDFWRMRHEENILFLTYEDMKRDHPSVIEKTAKFLGKSLNEDQILELADHLSFAKFSKNPSVNFEKILKKIDTLYGAERPDEDYNFVRKGVMGGFRGEMSPELIERFNKWTKNEVQKWNCDTEIEKILLFSTK
ncbi:sulfotransferase 1 family member D1-like [Lutzomyia longipalpis]|uniref:sulfotransferase 1 family member D1-like n=1 Tax=Lutzomyia longipalpis TaxID=7200 RepID=UPI0024842ADF|nr:sulfotransferase 1 family member D1-like [Lutzomyia longipalpis]